MADEERKTVTTVSANAPAQRYAAFVSYSHADEEIASWLHRRLETYLIPADLRHARGKRRIGRVFRDRVELSAAHDLGSEIRKALEASDALIVLCSPRSAQSRYVEEEIRLFKQMGRGQRVFAAIVDGEPHAAGKPGRKANEECFPRALLYRVGTDGALLSEPEPVEPIAADVRKGKDGRENGALKLIAGLLDVGLDELVQREKQAERARRRRAQIVAATMGVLALAAIGASVVALGQRDAAETQRTEAVRQRSVADAQRLEATVQRDQAERESATVAKRNSDLIAGDADELNKQWRHEAALLMSLHADPSAQRTLVSRKYDGANGYTGARAALTASFLSSRLELVLDCDDGVETAEFSPDGKRILTASGQHARIWNSRSGELLLTIATRGGVNSAKFSPDGKFIVTSEEEAARVWSTSKGRLLTTLIGHSAPVIAAAFSPDGKRIVTGGWDGTARVWDAISGAPILTYDSRETDVFGRPAAVTSVSFSPDGTHIISNAGNTERIWNATTGWDHQLSRDDILVASVGFSPDGLLFVRASGKAAVIANAISGETLGSLDGHEDIVSTADFSPDTKMVVTGSYDETARVWDMATGKVKLVLGGHTDNVSSAAFSPDSTRVLTAAFDGKVRVWNVAELFKPTKFDGHRDVVSAVAFSPDGEQFVSGSWDGTARLWSTASSNSHLTFKGHKKAVTSARFSKDGQRVVTGSWDGTAKIWDAATARVVLSIQENRPVLAAAFSTDGLKVLLGLGRGANSAHLRDAQSGDLLLTLTGHAAVVNSVEFSSDGTRLLTTSEDGTARVWDAASGVALFTLEGHIQPVSSAKFSSDGKYIATGSWDGTTRIWDAANGHPLLQLVDQDAQVRSVAFSPDSKLAASTYSDQAVRVWDVTTGRLLYVNVISENAGEAVVAPETSGFLSDGFAMSVEFSPSGSQLLSGWADGHIRAWAVPEIVTANAAAQVRMACQKLWQTKAPLAFTLSEIAEHPSLLGESRDAENPQMLVSPCRAYLSEEAVRTGQ
jgi:WD40 repeat protein